ncbi:hypothetical protein OFC04_25270, partial [Escherichia coli]|nr:hypothetical protein [Escherichia coli]
PLQRRRERFFYVIYSLTHSLPAFIPQPTTHPEIPDKGKRGNTYPKNLTTIISAKLLGIAHGRIKSANTPKLIK